MPGKTLKVKWQDGCYPTWVAALLFALVGISAPSKAGEKELPIAITGIFFSTPTEGRVLVFDKKKGTTEAYDVGQKIPDTDWEIFLIDHQRTYLRDAKNRIRVIIGSDSSEVYSEKSDPYQETEYYSQPEKVRANFLKTLGLEPVERGSSQGYLVSQDNNITKRNGLKKGDVIISLNGYPVGEAVSDIAAYRSYEQTGTASIEIKRGGNPITIYYERKKN